VTKLTQLYFCKRQVIKTMILINEFPFKILWFGPVNPLLADAIKTLAA